MQNLSDLRSTRTSYTPLTISQLNKRQLSDSEISAIQTYIIQENKRLISHSCCILFFLLILVLLLINCYRKTPKFLNSDLLFIFFFIIILLFIIVRLILQIKNPNHFHYKRAEDATVINQYLLKSSAHSNSPKTYYIDTFFPSHNGLLTKIICTKNTWEKITRNDTVLILSFDDKNCIAFCSEKVQRNIWFLWFDTRR